MVKIAKENFLHYKQGQVVLDEDYQENWAQHCEDKVEKPVKVEKKFVKKPIKRVN